MAKKREDMPKPVVVRQNADTSVSIDRVEPANWWIGMAESTVMLTIYGHNVALTRPTLSALGIRITGVRQTDSANYIFANIEIGAQAEAGVYAIELQKDNETVATANFELRNRRRGSAERQGFTSADTVYLAMPDRFAHAEDCGSDENTKEKFDRKHPRGRHGGNLNGIRRHVDYLHELGVTALWLTPVQTSDMAGDTFHGYAATDYYSVDPRFGTLADHRQLSASLSQWGIKLIMDIVVNHCGSEHPWMADAPGTGWFNEWDWKPERTNYRPGVAVDMHASQYDRRRTVEGWFERTMPDLNMRNPLVVTYLAQVAIWWIETADLKGLRVDTFPYSDAAGMEAWLGRIYREYPHMSVVGETWVCNSAKLASWATKSSLTSVMDFALQEAVTMAFCEDFGYCRGADRLYGVISDDHLYPHPENLLIFGDNHDTGRLFARTGNNPDTIRLIMTFLLTTRGIPQIYYGTEMLMEGESSRNDADIRRDMPGGWAGDREDWFAIAMGTASPKNDTQKARIATFNFISNILRFRQTSVALQTGRLTHFLPTENVYVYFRKAENEEHSETIMVVLNLEKKRVTLNVERFAELTGETLSGTDIITGRRYSHASKISASPRTALVIKLKDAKGEQ